MATHAHTTLATRLSPGHVFAQIAPDVALLALCADFRRLHAALDAAPQHDEAALDVAYTARQAVADRLMGMRPVTEAGRREKAAVGVTILEEVAAWQRDSEVLFALSAFRAEAFD